MIVPKAAKLHINSGDRIDSLIKGNIALVSWFTGRYPRPKHLSADEYWSELMIALYNAAATFDDSKSKFSTYATHGMFLSRLKLIQQSKAIKRKVHAPIIEEVVGKDSGDISNSDFKTDSSKVINELLSVLSDYQREVVLGVLETDNRPALARRMGKHRCTISECYRESVRKMRAKAVKEGMECPI